MRWELKLPMPGVVVTWFVTANPVLHLGSWIVRTVPGLQDRHGAAACCRVAMAAFARDDVARREILDRADGLVLAGPRSGRPDYGHSAGPLLPRSRPGREGRILQCTLAEQPKSTPTRRRTLHTGLGTRCLSDLKRRR